MDETSGPEFLMSNQVYRSSKEELGFSSDSIQASFDKNK